MDDREIDRSFATEELWTAPQQSAEAEVFPSMQCLAGVWNDERRAVAMAWLEELQRP